MIARRALICLAGLTSLPACALDLMQAWEVFQTQGPTYLAAQYERDAGLESLPIGRAGLLPKIDAVGSKSKVSGTQEQSTPNSSRVGTVSNDLDYDAENYLVRLRQPLFNKQKMAEYRQGEQRVKYSVAVFDAKSQNAAVRLAGRYFDVLLARETIDLAISKTKAFEQQVAASERRFKLGDGTVTDVDQSISKHDLAIAEQIEAEDNLLIALRLLQEMIGEIPQDVATLRNEFPTPPLQPESLQAWLNKAKANNPALQARQYSLGIADEQVNVAKSGHWPSLDLVAGYTDSSSDTVSTVNQTNRYSSIGLELTFPLYAGGGINAGVRRAVASREQASEEANATREEVYSAATREFRGIQSGEQRIKALQRAVVSSERAQDSARKGFRAGSATNLDIFNAEEQVFLARRDLVEAKLKYLLSHLQLQAAVGMLGDDDIKQANDYLGPDLALSN